MNEQFVVTDLNQVKRVPKRGVYDRETVFQVIDSAWLGHVGIVDVSSGRATVIPMLHARIEDSLIFHGANSSRLMKSLMSGQPVCVSFAMADGLVLAKSLFHHSMNYRSAVAFGSGQRIEGKSEQLIALKAVSDKIMPGRWADARQPSDKELSATAIVKVKIESASAKIRIGDPNDDPDDMPLPVWSGVLPFHASLGSPKADSNSAGLDIPEYMHRFMETRIAKIE